MIGRIVFHALLVGVTGAVATLAPAPLRAEPPNASKTKPDTSHGTALKWESNLEAATKRATREKKLLMVLAVAGHFEDSFFT